MTVPAVPVDAYAADLAQMIADALLLVLPYAAAMTAFVIGLRMLKRWLGHRSATSLGSSPSSAVSSTGRPGYDYAMNAGDDFDYDEYKRRTRRGENPGYGNRTWRKNAPPGAL